MELGITTPHFTNQSVLWNIWLLKYLFGKDTNTLPFYAEKCNWAAQPQPPLFVFAAMKSWFNEKA